MSGIPKSFNWSPAIQRPLKSPKRYEYPFGLDLRPGSELSKMICTEVMRSSLDSRHVMSNRYEQWKMLDRNHSAFLPKTEEEVILKEKNPRRPVGVVVPVSFATLETMLSYIMGVFLTDEFIVPYYGVGPEDAYGAEMMSHLVQQQAERAGYEQVLYVHWRDALLYGFGVMTPRWTTETNPTYVIRPQTEMDHEGNTVVTGRTKEVENKITWEGTKLLNIDPFDYLPDPNVPVHKVDDYEYAGWIEVDNRLSLLSREDQDSEGLFNCQYLEKVRRKSSLFAADVGREGGARDDRPTGGDYNRDSNVVDVVCQYRWLVPKEWGLGGSDVPEIWFFRIAADEVIIQAEPMDTFYGKIPMIVAAPDTDGYSVAPTSRMEIIYGLQEVVDWLFGSHIDNVSKAINDMLIVDPFKINVNDLLDPGPGKLVRTRRAAWGTGVRDAVEQLKVTDVTANHMNSVQSVIEIIRNTSAAVDSVQGIMRSGPERVTAEESRNTRMSALGRLQKIARLIHTQSHRRMGTMLASNNIQYMSQEHYVRISGDTQFKLIQLYGIEAEALEDRILVNPLDLCAQMDVRPLDLSNKSPEMVNSWMQLYSMIPNNPELMQTMDSTRIFLNIAKMMGARNATEFLRKGQINPHVVSDAEAQRMQAAGEVSPIGGEEPVTQ